MSEKGPVNEKGRVKYCNSLCSDRSSLCRDSQVLTTTIPVPRAVLRGPASGRAVGLWFGLRRVTIQLIIRQVLLAMPAKCVSFNDEGEPLTLVYYDIGRLYSSPKSDRVVIPTPRLDSPKLH